MGDERISWDRYFLAMAGATSTRATCPRLSVGAVLVRDRKVLATGYNGAPHGRPHCTDVGCAMWEGHCVPGDTVISKFQTGDYNSGHRTIREIWEAWQEPRKRNRMQVMNIRGVTPEGMIVPTNILDVWKTDIKPIYRMTTRVGRSVRLTADHNVLTASGWKPLSDITAGQDAVALNGIALYDDAAWLRQQYVVEGKTQQQIAVLAGCGRTLIRRRLDEFSIERREVHLGGWNAGMVRGGSARYKGESANPNSARSRSRRYALKDHCDICGAEDSLQVHHIDRIPGHDADDNLVTLCVPCHNLAHTPHAKRERILFVPVTQIEPDGEEEVFDITTGTGNFVGDGVVLHNCIRSIHAEVNALLMAGPEARGSVLYCTHLPCVECCKVIIQSDVYTVVAPEEGSYQDGRLALFGFDSRAELLLRSGVQVRLLDVPVALP